MELFDRIKGQSVLLSNMMSLGIVQAATCLIPVLIIPFVTKALSVNWTQTNINSASPDYNQTTTTDNLEYLNTLDIGFKLGIGYDFNRHWEIAANYTFGLNRISVYNNHKWRGVNLNLIYFF